VREVGLRTPQAEGLAHFLNQLEPVTKDLALRTDAVAIMTMARSKGLTFRAAFVMGVEDTVIPAPRAHDVEEERRMLYVAMTRAREYSFLTMARRRHDATARTGGGAPRTSRGRCQFFRDLGVEPESGEAYVRRFPGAG
jgi:superfamily I DNA/RNA helicase